VAQRAAAAKKAAVGLADKARTGAVGCLVVDSADRIGKAVADLAHPDIAGAAVVRRVAEAGRIKHICPRLC